MNDNKNHREAGGVTVYATGAIYQTHVSLPLRRLRYIRLFWEYLFDIHNPTDYDYQP
jgi:hypothetical protein